MKADHLVKILAERGVSSRRGSEKLVRAGEVTVDGVVVAEPGALVDPFNQVVLVGGFRLPARPKSQYLVLHKPKAVITSRTDPEQRPTVHSLLGDQYATVESVGRLDYWTEGLLLLTNDGELAHRLMHPSFEVPKTYLATVVGTVPRGLGRKLRDGIELDDGPVRVDDFAVVDAVPGKSLLRVTLHEGRKRIVRRLLAEVGFPVQELVRTDIGEVSLGDQRPGSIRVLTQKEIGELYKAVGL